MYGPTTEAAPGAGRGGLAACFTLGRLTRPQRVLKGLQLVRSRAAEDERALGRGSGQGQGLGQGGDLGAGEDASRLLLARPRRSGSSRFHTAVPSLSSREGGVAVRLLPVARPQFLSPIHRILLCLL